MKLKDNKGSITLFVLVGLLFMTSFLIITFGNNVNKSKVAKEQFNTISGIYSYNDGDKNAYDRAYAELRNKNKTSWYVTGYNQKSVIISYPFPCSERVENYIIYGTGAGLGNYDYTKGKYIIEIKVSNEEGYSQTYSIELENKLYENEYIEYRKQAVCYKTNSNLKELVSLPPIYTYDDYTKFEIINDNTPSQIKIVYIGYESIS